MAGKTEMTNGTPQKIEFPFEWIKGKLGGECPAFAMNDSVLNQFNKLKCMNLKADERMKNLGRVSEIAQIELNVQDENSSNALVLFGIDKSTLPDRTSDCVACVVQQAPGINEKMSCDVAVMQCMNKNAAMKTQRAKLNMLQKQAAQSLEQETKIVEKIKLENNRLQLELAAGEQKCQQNKAEGCEKGKHLLSLQEKKMALEQNLKTIEADENFDELHSAQKHAMMFQTKLDELDREQHELRIQVEKYASLPADCILAQEELEKLRSKLTDLKGEIAFLVSDMGAQGYM